jgi:transcriptional regulator with XRE-family HTH domain
MDNNSIKENIRSIRRRNGLTQEEMAHRLGISLTAYRDLEKGATAIFNSNIYKIAELTGTSTEEIVLGYRPEMPDVKIEDEQVEYSSKMESMATRINDLEKIVASLEETISSKNEIIAMLKKNIDGER